MLRVGRELEALHSFGVRCTVGIRKLGADHGNGKFDSNLKFEIGERQRQMQIPHVNRCSG
jgi:hypothetical protein